MSQVISNVPAAVLLSKFTDHVAALYLGVTVGGSGYFLLPLATSLRSDSIRHLFMMASQKIYPAIYLDQCCLSVIFFGIGFVLVTI